MKYILNDKQLRDFMKDEAYKKLEEKYKKKCEKIKELNKKIKNVEGMYNFYRSRHDMLSALERSLGYHCYTVNYKCRNRANLIHDQVENIWSSHPRLVYFNIMNRGYVDLKIISIEEVC